MVTKRSFLADGMSSADEESEVESESEPESGSESEAESEVESMAGASDTESDEEIDEAEEARRQEYFDIEENVDKSLPQSFNLMNLSRPILKGLAQLGFTKPTPIQARAIPIALLGKDICGGAVTGSGKTAAFFVPILERLLYRPRKNPAIRVLVLCPTRELAIQCHSVATKLAAFTDVNMCLCVGGLPMRAQETELRQRPDIVIATPGRLIDHLHNSRSFTVETLEILVMDEADRMLEDGFKAELTEIVENCPRSRQTMLFSATMTQNIDELIRLSLHKPALVQIDSAKQAAANLVQEFIRIRPNREADRPAVLLSLCRKTYKRRCIIFFRSKLAVREMKILFGLCGLSAAEIHGNLNQAQRSEALERFRDGEVEFLMATDVAARGLDIKGVETVINFNMPMQFAQYLHRVGRTARAGQSGRSVTLAGESDRKLLRLALKTAKKDRVRSRIIAPATIEKYKAKLETLKPQVEKILADDDDDQLLVKAEKDINRASNLIKYAEEIKARPAKAWFQSTAEKRQEKGKFHSEMGLG
ncbi:P-loop containing nucleoside triphosphate hydrolase protein [Dimargaris cristalligena]|uniref:RNA helicase n=1 Tax=Dimargaris cristalligena TaxID=215637 RepID=A0A4P9ZTY7_9FUNG|nr:P-loop containing nucleoside triphosphate hydrolase protein [Dimargaris cristalligena]|eukprot:RKP36995.1 P-loop containing nucleoside triphosphate hydrolase protein [Dimargaris cristalligena]